VCLDWSRDRHRQAHCIAVHPWQWSQVDVRDVRV
jgi:siderophore synthetase component